MVGTRFNTFGLLVIRHPDGIINWPQEAIDATDVKTQKLLISHGGLHPKSSTMRLYEQQREGGSGLASVFMEHPQIH